MKMYKKKGRLFFYRPEILESLKIRVEESLHPARLIIMENKDWEEYAVKVCGHYYANTGYYRYNIKNGRTYHPQYRGLKGKVIPCVFYRGIPTVNKKDWLSIK